MADLEFNCPKCDGHLVVDEVGAGKQVKCPDCGAPIVIPLKQPQKIDTPSFQPLSSTGAKEGIAVSTSSGTNKMADLKFDCPQCKSTIIVDKRDAGNRIKCSVCGEFIYIPYRTPDTEQNTSSSVPVASSTKCPKCGYGMPKQAQAARFCMKCGSVLNDNNASVQIQPNKPNNEIPCPKCFSPVNPLFLVCDHCGKALRRLKLRPLK